MTEQDRTPPAERSSGPTQPPRTLRPPAPTGAHERARRAAERLRRKIRIAFTSALLVVAVGVAAAVAVAVLVRAASMVDRSERTLDRLDALLLHIDDAETGQRGYLVTGDTTYLEPYIRALTWVHADTAALRAAVADDEARQRELDSLFPLVSEKLGELRQTIELRSARGLAAATEIVRSDRGMHLMDEIRRRVRVIEGAERHRLDRRSARRRFGAAAVLLVVVLGSTLSLMLAAVINRALRRDVVEQERAGLALEQQAELLQEQAAELARQTDTSQALAEESERSAMRAREAAAEAEAARDRAEESERRQQRASQSLAFLAEAARLLGRSLDLETTLSALTHHAVPFLADYCSVDMLGPTGEIRRVETTHVDPQKEPVVRKLWSRFPYRAEDAAGVPYVLRTREPILVPEFSLEEIEAFAHDPEQRAMLRLLGPRSYMCVPLVARGRAYGALSFVMSDSMRSYTPADLQIATELVARAATAIDNAHLFAAEQRARRRAAFLSDASALLASSLDYETTLQRAAQLAVPELSDWCAIDLVDADGSLRRVAAAHPDPEMLALGLELQRRFPTPPERSPALRVARSGRAEIYPTITEEMLAGVAQSEEHLAAMRRIGFSSVMVVPLVARGRVLGVLTCVASAPGRQHDADDLALAEALARRAALAVDNARLFREAEEARLRADEARAAAERASRSKSEFLATMSHEIRTPINAILGYTQLMELEISGPVSAEQRAQLERVSSSGRHLLGLIDDVLDLAKVEAGRLTVAAASAEAARAVDSSLALVRPQAAAKGVALSPECAGPRDLLYSGDEQRVQQILVNLLTNAVKFTAPGGRVVATCEAAAAPPPEARLAGNDSWAVFRVEDTGIGIAPEKLERIFQPFEQGESGYTRQHSGTGLGLTISRRLARLMGGDLTVESTPGEGSRFSLWLPAAARSTAGVAAPQATAPKAARGNGAGADRHDHALADLGAALRRDLDRIVARYVARLRAEPDLPNVARLSDVQLQDHAATWLADVAQAFVILQTAGDEPVDLLRDGSAIQHLIAERHGAQRYRLGWNEAALEREFAVLREVLDLEIIGQLDDGAAEGEAARELFSRFVSQAEQTSRRALAHAARTSARTARNDAAAAG